MRWHSSGTSAASIGVGQHIVVELRLAKQLSRRRSRSKACGPVPFLINWIPESMLGIVRKPCHGLGIPVSEVVQWPAVKNRSEHQVVGHAMPRDSLSYFFDRFAFQVLCAGRMVFRAADSCL